MTRLSAVFARGIDGKGITAQAEMPEDEKTRTLKRLYLFLGKVESEAKQKGLPDSVIFQDPFKNWRKIWSWKIVRKELKQQFLYKATWTLFRNLRFSLRPLLAFPGIPFATQYIAYRPLNWLPATGN